MVNDRIGRVNVLELHEEGRSRLESDEALKYMKFALFRCLTNRSHARLGHIPPFCLHFVDKVRPRGPHTSRIAIEGRIHIQVVW